MNIKANLKHAREKAEMLDLKNKKIMVVGAGISGIGASKLLVRSASATSLPLTQPGSHAYAKKGCSPSPLATK